MPKTFLQANLSYLTQISELLTVLEQDFYSLKLERFHGASIGAHIRHCLDHYDSFEAGLRVGEINYDLRGRHGDTEVDTKTAMQRITTLKSSLSELDLSSIEPAISVKMDCGLYTPNPWTTSSIFRELQFLASHTVHHLAIIAAMLHQMGQPVPNDFGVAPSTLAHQAVAMS